MNLGDYNKASSFFNRALSLHRALGYQEGIAYQLGRIASLQSIKGDYVGAIKLYREALEIHKNMGHVRGEAYWLDAIGQAYSALGDFNRALDNLQDALELHKSLNDPSGEAVALNTMGRTYLEIDEVDWAQSCFEEALKIHRDLGEQWDVCYVLGNLGYSFSLTEDSSAALKSWNEAVVLAQKIGERRLQGWLLLQLGDFYLGHNQEQKAAKAYKQALTITEGLDDPELRWELYLGQGNLSVKQGDYDDAYLSYHAAIRNIENIRSKGVIEEFKASIIHNRFEVYDAMVSVLVKTGRFKEAFGYSERARARSLLDQIGDVAFSYSDSISYKLIKKERFLMARIETLRSLISAEQENGQRDKRGTILDTYKNSLFEAQREFKNLLIDLKLQLPEYASLRSNEPFPLSDIQQLLDDKTLLLEYFVSEDHTTVFVLSNKNLKVISIPEQRRSIRGRITLFRALAVNNINEQKLSENFWQEPLHGLYKILIEPVREAGLLADKNHLILVPQGILHDVPFHALITRIKTDNQSRQQPRFLVEDYNISYTPSASILKYCSDKKSGQMANMLLLAPKIEVLPFTRQEVVNIKKSFGNQAEYWLGDDATESRLKRRSADFDIIHFATSAHFNKTNPIFSRLDLAASDIDDGRLDVYETFGLDLTANLVTLSACQTALGSGYMTASPRGDDFVSFTYAFLYGGTPSVVASLWDVNDSSTSIFMQRFYNYLKSNNKAEALAQTQRDMISGALSVDKLYLHPY